MSGEEWDADGFEPKAFVAPRISDKWEGEDEDDDVKDNWDDEEEEGGGDQTEKKSELPLESKAIQVKKKTLNKKLKEKQEEKLKEKQEEKLKEIQVKKQTDPQLSSKTDVALDNCDDIISEKQENSTPHVPEDSFEEKLRRQKLQEESDLELAKEAFGIAETSVKDDTGIDALEPSNDLLRDLCINLEADDIKRLGSTLNALSNEKVKAAKASKSKKKTASSKKVNLVVGRPNDYGGDYGDFGGDEFDDFM